LWIVVLAGFLLLLGIGLGGVGSHSFITVGLRQGNFPEIRRDIVGIAAGGLELLAQALHIKLPGDVGAEVDHQGHAAFTALRAVFLLFLLFRARHRRGTG